MKTLEFTIRFRGPFAVATGSAGGGIDQCVDPARALPASSLKGLMRAEARHRLGLREQTVAEVFGDHRQQPASWRWTDARIPDLEVGLWSRVRLDSQGRSDEHALMFGEQCWAKIATFAVVQLQPLDAGAEERHILLLRAAARHVSSLGKHRRRGMGWVSITDGLPWSDDDSQRLIALRAEAAS